jgi:putative thioredoxin
MEYDVMNFEVEVLEQSKERPQVVDFWAPWCQPCQILGPVLEKLATQANGEWDLKKVNVDENQQLATQFGVKGIPAVKLIINGEIVSEFSGALPEVQIQKWLKENVPSEESEQLGKVKVLFDEGKYDEALPVLHQIIEQNPQHSEVAFLLSKIYLFSDAEKAIDYLRVAQKDPQYLDETYYLNKIAELIKQGDLPDQLPEAPVKDKIKKGLQALGQKDFDTALKCLIEGVMIDKNYHNELPRESCIAIFKYLGETHEISRKYRRSFDMALY